MITQKHTTKFTARRVAMLSVLCAMGLITFMIESQFPSLFLPGAKMGLSNIFSMLAVFLLGVPDAIVLVAVRTVLGSMYSNMSALIYSLTAGLVSVLATSAMVEFLYPKISVIAVSVVAAVLHNLTQNVVFCLVSNTPEMFAYMPWLALLGVVAGIIVGFAVWFILRAVPLKVFASVLDVLGARLLRVLIYKVENGLFYSYLYLQSGNDIIRVDSRTSDAVAMAMRMQSPILVYEDILNAERMKTDDEEEEQPTIDSIKKALDEAIAHEEYEKAASLRDMINHLKDFK